MPYWLYRYNNYKYTKLELRRRKIAIKNIGKSTIEIKEIFNFKWI